MTASGADEERRKQDASEKKQEKLEQAEQERLEKLKKESVGCNAEASNRSQRIAKPLPKVQWRGGESPG